MELQHQLSAEQEAVVDFSVDAGHLLVLARPGSGKTHTLVSRARRLLRDGVEPSRVLAMTFSNRAAEQLKDRLPGGHIWAGTFHAISADILEQHGAAIGVRWPFRIVDEVRAREFLLRAVAEVGYPLPQDDKARNRFLRELKSRIERRKREGRERAEPEAGHRLDADVVACIDDCYCRLLAAANAFDFDDLIAKAAQTLVEDQVSAEALRNRLSHLLIDEFHDISPEQYHLITHLAPPRWRCQVCVVGDPDQSIYEWRGAHAGKMLARFRSDYRPAEFNLSVNFRSRAPIVSAADSLMRGADRTRPSQPHRMGRVLPSWCEFPDQQAEASEVAATITRARQSGHFAGYGSFAVLYRTHDIANVVEAELLRAEIPVHRVQRERFFHDPDAQESLRYLELAFGMHEEGFEPALNWPRVIVDEVTMVHLRRLAAQHDLRLAEIVSQVDAFADDLSPLTRAAIREFRDTIASDLGPIVQSPIDEALDHFLKVLKRRRSPIRRSERDALRDTLDVLTVSLQDAVAALDRATQAGRPLAMRVLDGPDCTAAATIVRHALGSYFGIAVKDIAGDRDSAEDEFLLTLGEESPSREDGFGLGRLPTRTVNFSVATRSWRLMQMLLMTREPVDRDRFVLIDIETSARHPEQAELLEFGAMLFSAGKVEKPGLVALLRPSSPSAIDPGATDIHGLRWSDVADALPPRDGLPPFLDMMRDRVVVGHNIEDFDLPVLRRVALGAGLPFATPLTIDTRRMAQRVWPDEPSYRLEDLVRRWSSHVVQEHRAGSDCLLAGQLFTNLLETARRDRELDILSECLPLVAASIIATDLGVVHDNELLVAIGARALLAGHGSRLWDTWAARVGATTSDALHSSMASVTDVSPDEDDRWDRFERGWRSAVDRFCAGAPDRGIGRFLHYAALAQPIDTLPGVASESGSVNPRALTADERVTMMTVHSAKGLEWPVVLVVGVEDDQFPLHWQPTADQLAEERRTLYVGMTRAMDRLLLFSTSRRDGRSKRRSRFIDPLIGDTLKELRPGQGAVARS